MISYLGYRHAQAVTGSRNPIKVGAPKRIGRLESGWTVVRLINEDAGRTLAVTMYIFNRSGLEQTLVLDGPNCRLLQPAQPGLMEFPARTIEFEPGAGGNVDIKLACSQSWVGGTKGRILFAATTHSGQPIRQKVRVDIRAAPLLNVHGDVVAS